MREHNWETADLPNLFSFVCLFDILRDMVI